MRRSSEFKFLLFYLLAAMSWENHSTFLSLSFLICEMSMNTKLHLCILYREVMRTKHGNVLEKAFSSKQAKPIEVFIITLFVRFITFPFTVGIFLQLLIFKEMEVS